MDSKSFDALTRGFGAQRNRREALKGLAAGLLGLGAARGAAAQVTIERANCGQSCDGSSSNCNAGLECTRTSGSGGICVRIADSRATCNRNLDCTRNFELCRSGRCVNQVNCSRCESNENCPTGRVCRNGNCSECTRDGQCNRNEVCRNGRCERDRAQCHRNRDCPRGKRCRNNRCKRK
jgi:hypothetical protein